MDEQDDLEIVWDNGADGIGPIVVSGVNKVFEHVGVKKLPLELGTFAALNIGINLLAIMISKSTDPDSVFDEIVRDLDHCRRNITRVQELGKEGQEITDDILRRVKEEP